MDLCRVFPVYRTVSQARCEKVDVCVLAFALDPPLPRPEIFWRVLIVNSTILRFLLQTASFSLPELLPAPLHSHAKTIPTCTVGRLTVHRSGVQS